MKRHRFSIPFITMFVLKEAFKTELGSLSIPTLESVHGMMPEKDFKERILNFITH